jgi:hypothetical protein
MLWLVLAIFFFWSAAASAGDYKVTYAIDLEGRTDAGRIETCVYGHTNEPPPWINSMLNWRTRTPRIYGNTLA